MFDRIIDAALQFIDFFKFYEIVEPYQRAIVLRLGRFSRELDNGFHWMIPFGVERALVDNVVPKTSNLGPQSLTSRDGKSVIVAAIVTWQIINIKKLLLEVEGAEDVMIDATYGIIAQRVLDTEFGQLHTSEFIETVQKEVRRKAFKYGIEVIAVQFSDLTASRSIRLWNGHPSA